MAQEGFDQNVASRMPTTKSGRPKRPWQVPPQMEQMSEKGSKDIAEDFSMDKSSMDNLSIEKKSMVDLSIDNKSRVKSSMDNGAIEKKSMDKSSIDKLSIERNRKSPDTFAYLFSHFLPKLDPARQTLLLWLVWLSDEQGQTPPMSYKDLSQRCGMSSKTAARTIKCLIKEGVIRIEKNAYSREATVYAITLPERS